MARLAECATTTAQAVCAVAERLSEAQVEGPRVQAEALVAAACGRSRESLLLHPEALLSPEELSSLEGLASRRAAREPLAYILGEEEFYSLSLRITRSAIVPRPETEVLVEAAIARASVCDARLALDVGTGCGAIAVALACHLPTLQVVGTDISQEALLLARENCVRHEVSSRVRLVRGDLLCGLRSGADCIIANLPYIRSEEFPHLQAEVRDFEPRVGLDGGRDGMALIRRLSEQLGDHLCDKGFAALEVGAGQAPEAAKLLLGAGLREVEVLPDLAGIDRVVIGWRRG